jgi:hypothetical protein
LNQDLLCTLEYFLWEKNMSVPQQLSDGNLWVQKIRLAVHQSSLGLGHWFGNSKVKNGLYFMFLTTSLISNMVLLQIKMIAKNRTLLSKDQYCMNPSRISVYILRRHSENQWVWDTGIERTHWVKGLCERH